MQSSMTFSSIAALFATTSILALVPSPSVFAVVARAIASGFTHAMVTVIGIVIGDFIFIIMAIYGLLALAETMNSLFVLIKYLGGAYLIWLGIKLWRAKANIVAIEGVKESSWLSNLVSGLFITLADPKAILFYMSFFPAFLELSNVTIIDTILIVTIVTLTVGGVKLIYAYIADKARLMFQSLRAKKVINMIAASITIGTGFFLIVKT